MFISLVLIILIIVSLRVSRNTDLLDQKRLLPIRGVLCILIVIHHVYREMPDTFNHWLIVYNNVGFWIVSMFFFFSGYGLSLSIEKKNNYLSKSFPSKKFYKILLPSLFIGFIYIVVYAYNGDFSFHRFLILLRYGQCIPTSHWFIYVLFYQYIIFYICFKKVKRYPLLIYTLVTIISMLTLYILNYPTIWFKSTIFICIGMLYFSYIKKGLRSNLCNDQRYSLYIILCCSIIFISTAILLKDISILKVFGNISISLLILFIFLQLSKHFVINNLILNYLGKNSMFIYLIHQPILDICKYLNKGYCINSELLLIIILFITYILASICNNIMKKIENIVR